MAKPKINVLFVCLGNICRSPAAEGTFLHLLKEQGLERQFRVDSCGTSAYHIGEPANRNAQRVATRYGIHLPSHARQFQRGDFAEFDYIFAMDRSNYEDLVAQARNDEDRARVHMFRSFDPEAGGGAAPDVPDPYYGGEGGFINVQEICLRTSRQIIATLTAG